MKNKTGASFVMAFVMPTIVGKSLMVYFGSLYSEYPGRGYGYGLAVSVAFTVFMLVRFVWKFRNYED